MEEENITRHFMIKQSNSKELVDMKKQERIYFSVKDYDKA